MAGADAATKTDPGKLGIVQSKPTAFNTKSSSDAQWKQSKKVSAPGKPPAAPKSSGKRTGK